MHTTIFIPGPTEVKRDMLDICATPMIGHRSEAFKKLYRSINKNLQDMLGLNGKHQVMLSTSSGSGIWEASARNLVKKKALCIINGAFAQRWYETVLANGKKAKPLEFPWNTGVNIDLIDKELSTGDYDAITIVYNETSIGVTNPIPELSEVMKRYPDVMFMVDAVSGMAGIPVRFDEWGIDVIFASVQKCFALPPGLTVFAVSDRAMEKSSTMENKGYYFDFEVFKKYHLKDNTPTTPALPQIFALDAQLKKIIAGEGFEGRYARHKEMADVVRSWAKNHFGLFVIDERYCSNTVTTIKKPADLDIAKLNNELKKRGKVVAGGYGKFKNENWRIGHMGDHSVDDVKALLKDIEDILGL